MIRMHISGAGAAVTAQPHSNNKSADVPPGLSRRGLDLPPGIAKKIEAGGAAPDGIAKRFPAAAPPAPQTSSPPSEPAGEQPEPPAGVDILV
jgi:hypothetical protein